MPELQDIKNRTILWLVGQQCAGKTFLTRILQPFGAQVLNIGEMLRKRHDVVQFLESDNQYAPSFTEDTVREMILDGISQFNGEDALVNRSGVLLIDSAPRNLGQLEMVKAFKGSSAIIFVMEDYGIRRERARQKYGNDLTFFEKREAFEREWIDVLWNMPLKNIPKIILPGTSHEV